MALRPIYFRAILLRDPVDITWILELETWIHQVFTVPRGGPYLGVLLVVESAYYSALCFHNFDTIKTQCYTGISAW